MQTQKSQQIVQSPRNFWVAAIPIIGLCMWFLYYYTRPHTTIGYVVDVSNSIDPSKEKAVKVCEQLKDSMSNGDTLISIAFADTSKVTGNASYDENRTTLDCSNITKKPAGVGKSFGTFFEGALNDSNLVLQHHRQQGNKQLVVLVVVIDAAEAKPGQKVMDPKVVKESLKQITQNGYAIIIGSELVLQGLLTKELVDMPNVRLCGFEEAKECGLDWAFEKVRKYPWQ
jgi:hypothetical protein